VASTHDSPFRAVPLSEHDSIFDDKGH
jgi:hypothetical protein